MAQYEKCGKYEKSAPTPCWTLSGQPLPRPSRPLAASRDTPLSPGTPGQGAWDIRQGAGCRSDGGIGHEARGRGQVRRGQGAVAVFFFSLFS